MPAYITKALWCADGDHGAVHVQYAGNDNEGEGRNSYLWSFFLHGEVVARSTFGDEIHSGVGDDIDAMKVLATLASFVGAWREAYESCERQGRPWSESENANLFPSSLRPWVDEYGQEFELWGYDHENDEEG